MKYDMPTSLPGLELNENVPYSEISELINDLQGINDRIAMISNILENKGNDVFGHEPSRQKDDSPKVPEPVGLLESFKINLHRTHNLLDELEPAARRFLRL
jgi:hypothetical protein